MEPTDLDTLNSARNAVTYGNRKNSLVEWTLSDEWTKPCGNQLVRGEVWRDGDKWYGYCNNCEGEIDAKS